MEKTNIEAVRGIFKALDKSITKDGIFLTRVQFKRNGHIRLRPLTLKRVSNPQTRARDNPQGKRQREERKP